MVDNNDLISVDPESLARLCVEYWKLSKACSRVSNLLPEKDERRLTAQVKFSDLQLLSISEKLGIRIISFDGEVFLPGIAASADNADEFNDGEDLVVIKTIEPTIIHSMKVLSQGRVLIGRADHTKKEES